MRVHILTLGGLLLGGWAGCGRAFTPPTYTQIVPPVPEMPALMGTTLRQRERTRNRREEVVAAAQRFLDGEPLEVRDYVFEHNPVGFIRAAYWEVGVELYATEALPQSDTAPEADGMAVLYRSAGTRSQLHYRKIPRIGDLVFFDADANRSELYPRQAAIVEGVEPRTGTVSLIGLFNDGPAKITMNLKMPKVVDENGHIYNQPVIDGTRPVPIAQLFRAFADPFE